MTNCACARKVKNSISISYVLVDWCAVPRQVQKSERIRHVRLGDASKVSRQSFSVRELHRLHRSAESRIYGVSWSLWHEHCWYHLQGGQEQVQVVRQATWAERSWVQVELGCSKRVEWANYGDAHEVRSRRWNLISLLLQISLISLKLIFCRFNRFAAAEKRRNEFRRKSSVHVLKSRASDSLRSSMMSNRSDYSISSYDSGNTTSDRGSLAGANHVFVPNERNSHWYIWSKVLSQFNKDLESYWNVLLNCSFSSSHRALSSKDIKLTFKLLLSEITKSHTVHSVREMQSIE